MGRTTGRVIRLTIVEAAALRRRAARNGRSMNAEILAILRRALARGTK